MSTAFNLTAQINMVGPTNLNTVVAQIRRELGTINTSIDLKISASSARNIQALTSNLAQLNAALTQTSVMSKDVAANFASLSNSMAGIQRGATSARDSISGVTKAGRSSADSLKGASSAMENFGAKSALAVQRFAAFAGVTTVLYGLTSAITSAYGEFISFDKEMVKLTQVTGKSLDGLRELSSEITRLATNFGVSSSELLNVSSTLAQAGLSANDTKIALEALAKSSLAPSFDTMAETTEGAIAVFSQFEIKARDLESVLGSINAVSAAFAVEASDIITAIQRTGGVFASASKGVSGGTQALNEFIAVFTSVRATTRESAETIATGLRTIFTRIQRGDTIEALKEYGITLTDLDGKFVGAYEATRRLSAGLKSLDTRDLRFGKIVEELGGFRQIGKVIPLIQQFAVSEEALKVALGGQDSLAKNAVQAQASLAVQFMKTRENFVAFIRELGDSSTFRTLTTLALGFTDAVINIGRAFQPILPYLAILGAVKGTQAAIKFTTGFAGAFDKGGGVGGLGERLGGGGTASSKESSEAKVKMIEALSNNTSEINKLTNAISPLTSGISTLNNQVANLISALTNPSSSSAPATINSGGFVRKFARGGVVPGSGSGDTVPAMLEPGEFVIRKKAVETLGASNLHKMNKSGGGSIKVGGYAGGGTIQKFDKGGLAGISEVIPNTAVAKDGDTFKAKVVPNGEPFTASFRVKNFDTYEKTKPSFVTEKKAREIQQLNKKKRAYPNTSSGYSIPNKDKVFEEATAGQIAELGKDDLSSQLKNFTADNIVKTGGGGFGRYLAKGFTMRDEYTTGRKWDKGTVQLAAGGKIQYSMDVQQLGIGGVAKEKMTKANVPIRDMYRRLGKEGRLTGTGITDKDFVSRVPNKHDDIMNRLIIESFADEEAVAQKAIAGSEIFGLVGLIGKTKHTSLGPEMINGKSIYTKIGMLSEKTSASLQKQMEGVSASSTKNLAESMQAEQFLGSGKNLAIDFDETLVSGADILNEAGQPDIEKYFDMEAVSKALQNAQLKSPIGTHLKEILAGDPKFIEKIRVLSARPQTSAGLIASTLNRLGIPIGEDRVTGVSTPGMTGEDVAKAKAKNLGYEESLIDDNLQNVLAARAANKTAHYLSPVAPMSQEDLAITGKAEMEGYTVQQILTRLGAPAATRGAMSMDFPKGLGAAAQFFGIEDNIPTDVKRTIDSSSIGKYREEVLSFLEGRDGIFGTKGSKAASVKDAVAASVDVKKASQKSGSAVQRNIGYIDSDVLADPQNSAVVGAGMSKLGMTKVSDYKMHLSNLAAAARSGGSLDRLSAIVGVAGSGKSSLMLGGSKSSEADNASLRQTTRSPILTPEDISSVSQIVDVTATVSPDRLSGHLTSADKVYSLSSSTKEEREEIKRRRGSRDVTGNNLFGRSPGATAGAPTDSGPMEGMLASEIDPKKLRTLGITSAGFSRKMGPTVETKPLAVVKGGFAPTTLGHESMLDAAKAMGFAEEDFVALVGSNEGITAKDPDAHDFRTVNFDQDFRTILAKAAFSKSIVNKADPGFGMPDIFEGKTGEDGRRHFVRPDYSGSVYMASGKTDKQLQQYKDKGYSIGEMKKRTTVEGGDEEISGTVAREAILSGDIPAMRKFLSPAVFDIVQKNLTQLQNRDKVLPEIMEGVKSRKDLSLASIDAELANFPARIDRKKMEDDPAYKIIGDQVDDLRERKKKIQSHAGFEPFSLMRQLAQEFPEKYGLSLTGGQASLGDAVNPQQSLQAKPPSDVIKRAIGGRIPKLGKEVYDLQKGTGLKDFEFDQAKQFGDTMGYGMPEFKTYLAKIMEQKKSKAGMKIDSKALAESLKVPSSKTSTPAQLDLAAKLMGPSDAAYTPTPSLAEDMASVNRATRGYAVGGAVEVFHGSNSGTNDSAIEKFKKNGVQNDIAQGYGQGAGFYVWSDLASAKTHATNIVKSVGPDAGANPMSTGAETTGSKMVVTLKEILDPNTWDVDYELNKNKVVSWIAANSDQLKPLLAREKGQFSLNNSMTKEDNKSLVQVRDDSGEVGGPRTAWIHNSGTANVAEGAYLGQLMNRLQAKDPSVVHPFEEEFFSSMGPGVAIKYVGGERLTPSSIEKFAKGGAASDTVPAMLTPGEFVINKKAAETIGYSKLNKMNHADKAQGFARGGSVGYVQSFADGTGPEGVLDAKSREVAGDVLRGIVDNIEARKAAGKSDEKDETNLISLIKALESLQDGTLSLEGSIDLLSSQKSEDVSDRDLEGFKRNLKEEKPKESMLNVNNIVRTIAGTATALGALGPTILANVDSLKLFGSNLSQNSTAVGVTTGLAKGGASALATNVLGSQAGLSGGANAALSITAGITSGLAGFFNGQKLQNEKNFNAIYDAKNKELDTLINRLTQGQNLSKEKREEAQGQVNLMAGQQQASLGTTKENTTESAASKFNRGVEIFNAGINGFLTARIAMRHSGGPIYASKGTLVDYSPKGSDTVPAMLTPGEFVVNKTASSKNLPLLKAINKSSGGIISASYFAAGGSASDGNTIISTVWAGMKDYGNALKAFYVPMSTEFKRLSASNDRLREGEYFNSKTLRTTSQVFMGVGAAAAAAAAAIVGVPAALTTAGGVITRFGGGILTKLGGLFRGATAAPGAPAAGGLLSRVSQIATIGSAVGAMAMAYMGSKPDMTAENARIDKQAELDKSLPERSQQIRDKRTLADMQQQMNLGSTVEAGSEEYLKIFGGENNSLIEQKQAESLAAAGIGGTVKENRDLVKGGGRDDIKKVLEEAERSVYKNSFSLRNPGMEDTKRLKMLMDVDSETIEKDKKKNPQGKTNLERSKEAYEMRQSGLAVTEEQKELANSYDMVFVASMKASAAQNEMEIMNTKLAKAAKIASVNTENFLNTLHMLSRGMTRATAELAQNMNQMDINVGSRLSGKATIEKADRTNENIISNPAAYTKEEVTKATTSSNSILGLNNIQSGTRVNSEGKQENITLGQRFEESAQATRLLTQGLPAIFNQKASAGNAEEANLSQGEVKDLLTKGGMGEESASVIAEQTVNAYNKAKTGDGQVNLASLSQDVPGFLNGIKAIKEANTIYLKLIKDNNDALDVFNSKIQLLSDSMVKIAESRSSTVKSEASFQLQMDTLNRPQTLSAKNRGFNDEVRELSTTRDSNGKVITAGTTDPNELAKRIEQANRDNVRSAAAVTAPGVTDATLEIERQARLRNTTTINQSQKALEKLASDSTRAANAMGELEKLKQLQETKQTNALGGLKTLLSGSVEEKMKMISRQGSLEIALNGGAGSLNNQQLSDAIDGLQERLPNLDEAGQKDLKKRFGDTVVPAITQRLGGGDANTAMAQAYINKIFENFSSQQGVGDLQSEARAAQEEMIKAQTLITEQQLSGVKIMEVSTRDSARNFYDTITAAAKAAAQSLKEVSDRERLGGKNIPREMTDALGNRIKKEPGKFGAFNDLFKETKPGAGDQAATFQGLELKKLIEDKKFNQTDEGKQFIASLEAQGALKLNKPAVTQAEREEAINKGEFSILQEKASAGISSGAIDISRVMGDLLKNNAITIDTANLETLFKTTRFEVGLPDDIRVLLEGFINSSREYKVNNPIPIAKGGMVYASSGKHINFEPRGTDTVPAMLTPGEFVINRSATQKNLSLLKDINSGAAGYSSGGVAYLAGGKLLTGSGGKSSVAKSSGRKDGWDMKAFSSGEDVQRDTTIEELLTSSKWPEGKHFFTENDRIFIENRLGDKRGTETGDPYNRYKLWNRSILSERNQKFIGSLGRNFKGYFGSTVDTWRTGKDGSEFMGLVNKQRDKLAKGRADTQKKQEERAEERTKEYSIPRSRSDASDSINWGALSNKNVANTINTVLEYLRLDLTGGSTEEEFTVGGGFDSIGKLNSPFKKHAMSWVNGYNELLKRYKEYIEETKAYGKMGADGGPSPYLTMMDSGDQVMSRSYLMQKETKAINEKGFEYLKTATNTYTENGSRDISGYMRSPANIAKAATEAEQKAKAKTESEERVKAGVDKIVAAQTGTSAKPVSTAGVPSLAAPAAGTPAKPSDPVNLSSQATAVEAEIYDNEDNPHKYTAAEKAKLATALGQTSIPPATPAKPAEDPKNMPGYGRALDYIERVFDKAEVDKKASEERYKKAKKVKETESPQTAAKPNPQVLPTLDEQLATPPKSEATQTATKIPSKQNGNVAIYEEGYAGTKPSEEASGATTPEAAPAPVVAITPQPVVPSIPVNYYDELTFKEYIGDRLKEDQTPVAPIKSRFITPAFYLKKKKQKNTIPEVTKEEQEFYDQELPRPLTEEQSENWPDARAYYGREESENPDRRGRLTGQDFRVKGKIPQGEGPDEEKQKRIEEQIEDNRKSGGKNVTSGREIVEDMTPEEKKSIFAVRGITSQYKSSYSYFRTKLGEYNYKHILQSRREAYEANKAARRTAYENRGVRKVSEGGLIYLSDGGGINFQPKGTDTVPAMLTPGEFVVNRAATQQNLPLLKQINSGATATGYSSGGIAYLQNGGVTDYGKRTRDTTSESRKSEIIGNITPSIEKLTSGQKESTTLISQADTKNTNSFTKQDASLFRIEKKLDFGLKNIDEIKGKLNTSMSSSPAGLDLDPGSYTQQPKTKKERWLEDSEKQLGEKNKELDDKQTEIKDLRAKHMEETNDWDKIQKEELKNADPADKDKVKEDHRKDDKKRRDEQAQEVLDANQAIADLKKEINTLRKRNLELQSKNETDFFDPDAHGINPGLNGLQDDKAGTWDIKDQNRKFQGGLIYASGGQHINFEPRGTDTVPAMLTPGEFIVNRAATQKNLSLLKDINSGATGYSSGGVVYLADGSPEPIQMKGKQARSPSEIRANKQEKERLDPLVAEAKDTVWQVNLARKVYYDKKEEIRQKYEETEAFKKMMLKEPAKAEKILRELAIAETLKEVGVSREFPMANEISSINIDSIIDGDDFIHDNIAADVIDEMNKRAEKLGTSSKIGGLSDQAERVAEWVDRGAGKDEIVVYDKRQRHKNYDSLSSLGTKDGAAATAAYREGKVNEKRDRLVKNQEKRHADDQAAATRAKNRKIEEEKQNEAKGIQREKDKQETRKSISDSRMDEYKKAKENKDFRRAAEIKEEVKEEQRKQTGEDYTGGLFSSDAEKEQKTQKEETRLALRDEDQNNKRLSKEEKESRAESGRPDFSQTSLDDIVPNENKRKSLEMRGLSNSPKDVALQQRMEEKYTEEKIQSKKDAKEQRLEAIRVKRLKEFEKNSRERAERAKSEELEKAKKYAEDNPPEIQRIQLLNKIKEGKKLSEEEGIKLTIIERDMGIAWEDRSVAGYDAQAEARINERDGLSEKDIREKRKRELEEYTRRKAEMGSFIPEMLHELTDPIEGAVTKATGSPLAGKVARFLPDLALSFTDPSTTMMAVGTMGFGLIPSVALDVTASATGAGLTAHVNGAKGADTVGAAKDAAVSDLAMTAAMMTASAVVSKLLGIKLNPTTKPTPKSKPAAPPTKPAPQAKPKPQVVQKTQNQIEAETKATEQRLRKDTRKKHSPAYDQSINNRDFRKAAEINAKAKESLAESRKAAGLPISDPHAQSIMENIRRDYPDFNHESMSPKDKVRVINEVGKRYFEENYPASNKRIPQVTSAEKAATKDALLQETGLQTRRSKERKKAQIQAEAEKLENKAGKVANIPAPSISAPNDSVQMIDRGSDGNLPRDILQEGPKGITVERSFVPTQTPDQYTIQSQSVAMPKAELAVTRAREGIYRTGDDTDGPPRPRAVAAPKAEASIKAEEAVGTGQVKGVAKTAETNNSKPTDPDVGKSVRVAVQESKLRLKKDKAEGKKIDTIKYDGVTIRKVDFDRINAIEIREAKINEQMRLERASINYATGTRNAEAIAAGKNRPESTTTPGGNKNPSTPVVRPEVSSSASDEQIKNSIKGFEDFQAPEAIAPRSAASSNINDSGSELSSDAQVRQKPKKDTGPINEQKQADIKQREKELRGEIRKRYSPEYKKMVDDGKYREAAEINYRAQKALAKSRQDNGLPIRGDHAQPILDSIMKDYPGFRDLDPNRKLEIINAKAKEYFTEDAINTNEKQMTDLDKTKTLDDLSQASGISTEGSRSRKEVSITANAKRIEEKAKADKLKKSPPKTQEATEIPVQSKPTPTSSSDVSGGGTFNTDDFTLPTAAVAPVNRTASTRAAVVIKPVFGAAQPASNTPITRTAQSTVPAASRSLGLPPPPPAPLRSAPTYAGTSSGPKTAPPRPPPDAAAKKRAQDAYEASIVRKDGDINIDEIREQLQGPMALPTGELGQTRYNPVMNRPGAPQNSASKNKNRMTAWKGAFKATGKTNQEIIANNQRIEQWLMDNHEAQFKNYEDRTGGGMFWRTYTETGTRSELSALSQRISKDLGDILDPNFRYDNDPVATPALFKEFAPGVTGRFDLDAHSPQGQENVRGAFEEATTGPRRKDIDSSISMHLDELRKGWRGSVQGKPTEQMFYDSYNMGNWMGRTVADLKDPALKAGENARLEEILGRYFPDVYKSTGGVVYASGGALMPSMSRGTDTVPAMLTPGEFVVNQKSAKQNMGLLQSINQNSPLPSSYYSRGGGVGYYSTGAEAQSSSSSSGSMSIDFSAFTTGVGLFSSAVEHLKSYSEKIGSIDFSSFSEGAKTLNSSINILSSSIGSLSGSANLFNSAAKLFGANIGSITTAINALSKIPTTITLTGRIDMPNNITVTLEGNTQDAGPQMKREILSAVAGALRTSNPGFEVSGLENIA